MYVVIENIVFFLYLSTCLPFNSVIGNIVVMGLYILQQYFHIQCILSKPGLAARDRIEFEDPLTEDQATRYYCRQCDMIRWAEVRHCDTCNVCVKEWHTHSRLIGKCVGSGNRKRYLALIILSGILVAYLLIGIAFRLASSPRHP